MVKLQKKIKIDNLFTPSRDNILNFYQGDYRKNLEILASSSSKLAEQKKEGKDLT